MNDDPLSTPRSGRLVRTLWVLGLVVGIAIGAVVAIGLATTAPQLQTEEAS